MPSQDTNKRIKITKHKHTQKKKPIQLKEKDHEEEGMLESLFDRNPKPLKTTKKKPHIAPPD